MTETLECSQTHATFTIERAYDVPVERLWRALTDDAERRHWFGGGDAFEETERSHDFRVGGRSVEDGQWHGGPRSRFEGVFTDIVEHQRIVMTYDMWIDGRHISTSLQTMALGPHGDGSRLTLVEQAVHLDGIDSPEGREEGTRGLLEQLGDYLAR
jgi:uncharacterized protein YndB with AHSA1/START domain